MRNNGLLNNMRTPAVPGDLDSMEMLQRFTDKQKQAVGFIRQVGTGQTIIDNMAFPGSARLLLGFTINDLSKDIRNVFTLNINSQDIIQEASWADYTKTVQFVNAANQASGSSFKDEYYMYLRALSGNDKIKITYNAATAGVIQLLFRYKTTFDVTEIAGK